MFWLWFTFSAIVGLLVRRQGRAKGPSFGVPVRWFLVGLAFVALVYPIYELGWFGATLYEASDQPGIDASLMFVSAYLMAYALSFDASILTAMHFHEHRVPESNRVFIRHAALIGTMGIRVLITLGATWFVHAAPGVLYVFAALTLVSAITAIEPTTEDDPQGRWLFGSDRIARADLRDQLTVVRDGRRLLTVAGAFALSIVVADAGYALESVYIVSATQTTFLVVAATVLATLAQRAWCYASLAAVPFPRRSTIALLLLVVLKLATFACVAVPPAAYSCAIAALIGLGITESTLIADARAD